MFAKNGWNSDASCCARRRCIIESSIVCPRREQPPLASSIISGGGACLSIPARAPQPTYTINTNVPLAPRTLNCYRPRNRTKLNIVIIASLSACKHRNAFFFFRLAKFVIELETRASELSIFCCGANEAVLTPTDNFSRPS